MKAVAELIKAGFAFTVVGERIRYQWTRPEPPDQEKVVPLLEAIRADKAQAVEYLRAMPGNCGNCPAAGFWDGYGPWKMLSGKYCFHSAYFKGKPARPILVADAKGNCPKKTDGAK